MQTPEGGRGRERVCSCGLFGEHTGECLSVSGAILLDLIE